jgi:hypothetical protein
MKRWKSMLAMVLSAAMAIAFGVTGCGDDENEVYIHCDELCSRIYDCRAVFVPPVDNFRIQDCTDDCISDPGKPVTLCAFDCDTTSSCQEFSPCITDCGVF